MSPPRPTPPKQELRRQHRTLRAALASETRESEEHDVRQHLTRVIRERGVTRVGGYRALRAELDLAALWRELEADGVEVVYPRVEPNRSLAYAPPSGGFRRSAFGVEEPCDDAVEAVSIGLVVVPCVACDAHGVRLGHGAGHYDRFFEHHPELLSRAVAAVFRNQFVESLPREPHDRLLAAVVTPDGVTETSRSVRSLTPVSAPDAVSETGDP